MRVLEGNGGYTAGGAAPLGRVKMRVLECSMGCGIMAAFLLLLMASFSLAVDVPDVKLSVLSTPASATPGSSFAVQVQAVNNGAGIAKLVKLYPEITKPFSIKEGTNSELLVDELRYGRNLVTDFSFTVSPDALSDTYKIKIFAEYMDQNNNIGKVSQEVPITVAGTPLLELMGVAMPEKIVPGDSAGVQITLRNIGTANARNVRAMFANLTDPSVKPSGNPVAYVENAPAGSEKVLQLSFAVDGKAHAKSYLLPIIIAYQDKDGNDFSLLRLASVKVESQIALDAFSSNQEPLVAGAAGKVGVTVANVGQHDAEFLMFEVLDAGIYPKDTYIGTLDTNDYSTVDLKLTPVGSGEKQLRLRLTYRDQYNRESVLERNISYSVISAAEFAKEQPKSIWTYAIPAILLLGTAYWIYRKLRK